MGIKMQKKTLLFPLLVLGLSTILLIGPQNAFAQYTPNGDAFILVSPINIASPLNCTNCTYTSQPLVLNFSVKSSLKPEHSMVRFAYSIDGGENTTLDVQFTPVPLEYIDANGSTAISIFSYYLITGYTAIPDMPNGQHNITVYGKYEFPGSYHNIGLDNRTVLFTVDSGIGFNSTEGKVGNETDTSGFAMTPFSTNIMYVIAGVLTVSAAISVATLLKFKRRIR